MTRFPFMLTVAALLLALGGTVQGVERFPPPDFESGYAFPGTTTPPPRADIYELVDVVMLFAALVCGTVLILKKRSRRGVFVLSVICLLYFGFWRKGCMSSCISQDSSPYCIP